MPYGSRIDRPVTGTNFRVLNVTTSGDVELNDLVVANGRFFGGIKNQGKLTLNRSDVTGSENYDSGGGIQNIAGASDATLTLNESSVFNSLAYYGNGGETSQEVVATGGTLKVTNSLIGHSGLTTGQVFAKSSGVSSTQNWTTATSNGADPTPLGNILDTTLADNGGSTQTAALLIGRPAVDVVPTGRCSEATDQ